MLNLGEVLEAAEREAKALRQAGKHPWRSDLPIDHIGFAVFPTGLEAALETWRLLGYLVAERDLVASQKAWATMLRLKGDVKSPGPGLELVMPALELETPEVVTAFEARETAPGMSAISQYLVRNRPGLHPLAFTVPEGTLNDFRTHLIESGVDVIGDGLRPGAFGTTVFFTKPDRGRPDRPGPSVLIEYVDTTGAAAWRQQRGL